MHDNFLLYTIVIVQNLVLNEPILSLIRNVVRIKIV